MCDALHGSLRTGAWPLQLGHLLLTSVHPSSGHDQMPRRLAPLRSVFHHRYMITGSHGPQTEWIQGSSPRGVQTGHSGHADK